MTAVCVSESTPSASPIECQFAHSEERESQVSGDARGLFHTGGISAVLPVIALLQRGRFRAGFSIRTPECYLH